MTLNVPPKLRVALYVGTAVLTPVVGYLYDKNIIGALEVALWLGEVTVISSLAAFNVDTSKVRR